MKEMIILFLERGSVWLFVSVIYFAVTMCVGWLIKDEDTEHEQLEAAHFVGCFLFGVVFCLWLYG